MDAQRDPVPSQLFRLLVAADASVDPHRLIGLYCESAGRAPLAVSLLVAVDDLSGPGAEAGARAPVLPLAARLARQYGLPVLGDGPRLAAASPGWLRRVVDPLLRRQRPQERA